MLEILPKMLLGISQNLLGASEVYFIVNASCTACLFIRTSFLWPKLSPAPGGMNCWSCTRLLSPTQCVGESGLATLDRVVLWRLILKKRCCKTSRLMVSHTHFVWKMWQYWFVGISGATYIYLYGMEKFCTMPHPPTKNVSYFIFVVI